jgi:putative NADH-flavin reductase
LILPDELVVATSWGDGMSEATKVVVFGAAGNLGQRLVRAGLANGHAVTAFVRDEQGFRTRMGGTLPDGLALRVGDLRNGEAVGAAMAGQDAAVNAAGHATEGDDFVALCRTVIAAAETPLAPPGRLWLMGGAAALSVPHTRFVGVDLPGVPVIYEAHRRNHQQLMTSTLDWSLMCPGPLVPLVGDRLTEGMRVSVDTLPYAVPRYAAFLPRIGLSLMMKAKLPETIVSYEDVAALVMSHLARGGPFARRRVGIALPAGQTGVKSGWVPGQR